MNVYNTPPNVTSQDHQLTSKPLAPLSTFPRKPKIAAGVIPTTLLALATALGASLPAHGTVKEGQFEISPFVGYHFFEGDQNLEDAVTYGIRFGYSFTPHWAIEGAASMVNSNVDDESIVGTAEGQFRSPIEDVDLTLYQLDALYHFRPNNRFSPYIVGGYGAVDYSPSISDKAMSAFNLGIGAKYWVAENLALRLDVRNHLVSEVFDHSYNNISATMGVSFAFGGRDKSEPVAAAPEPVVHEPVAEPEPVRRAPPAEVTVLEFEDIHFNFDDATLTPEALRVLQRSISTLQDHPKAKVRIAGYASAAGTAEHNQALSERRATAIKNYLTKNGVDEQRLSVIGYGDTRPISHEASPEKLDSTAAKENMRASFEIIDQ